MMMNGGSSSTNRQQFCVLVFWGVSLLVLFLWNHHTFQEGMQELTSQYDDAVDAFEKEASEIAEEFERRTLELESSIQHMTAIMMSLQDDDDDDEDGDRHQVRDNNGNGSEEEEEGEDDHDDAEEEEEPITVNSINIIMESSSNTDYASSRQVKDEIERLMKLATEPSVKSFSSSGSRTSSVMKDLREEVLQLYSTLYSAQSYLDLIVSFRGGFQGYIAAIEKRKDRMLYNYI